MLAGSLEIQLLANIARLQQDMDKAKAVVGGATKEIERMAGFARAALGGLASGLSVAGLIAVVRATIDAADAMNDLHLKTGLSFKSLAQFDLLARQSGVSTAEVAESVKYLQRYMVEHGENLRAIGVTSTDSATALGQFADVISTIEDPALRTSLAMEVLGRSGAQMLPMLLNGKEGFDAAAKASEEYGKQLEISAPLADAMNDNLEQLSTSGKLLALNLSSELLPGLVNISKAMVEAARDGGLFNAVLVGIGGAVSLALDPFKAFGLWVAKAMNEAIGHVERWLAKITFGSVAANHLRESIEAFARAQQNLADIQAMSAKGTTAAATADNTATKAASARVKALDAIVRKMLDGTKAAKEHKAATDQMTAAEWAMEESAHATRTALALQAEAREYDVVAQEKQMAAVDAYIERLNAWEASQDAAKDSLEHQVRSVEESTLALTLNADQLREHNIQLALESSGLDRASEAWGQYEQRLRTAYAELQKAQDQKVATDEMADMWESAENAAHQFFSGLLSGGKDAWTRLKDSAEALFFDWLYSMTLKKWIISVGASFSGSAVAGQAAGSAMSGGSILGGITGLSESIGMMAGGIAEMAGASSAMAGSIGSFVATALPWVAGLGLVSSLISAFSTGGTPHQGTSMQFGLGGGTTTLGRADLGGQLPNWLADMGDSSPFAAAVEQLGVSMVQQLNADMASLGATLGADFALQFGFAAEREAETQSGGFARVMIGGETVLELYDRYARDGAKGMEQFAADVLPRVRLAAIQMADGLSPALDTMADSLDPATASVNDINTLLQQIGESGAALNLQATFLDLGMTLGATDDQIIATGIALADLAGGFDALQAGLSAYYSAFYSTEEQLGILRGNLEEQFAALGQSLPTTRDGFRALIEGIDLTTDAGRSLYSDLIALSPALAELIDATDAETATRTADALALSNARRDLEADLMEAQGDTAGALAARRRLELEAMDESLRALQEQVWAELDAAEARQATAAVEADRRALEIQLLELSGDTVGALAAARADELAQMDPSLRALQQQVWAMEDAQQGAKQLTTQIGYLAQKFESTYGTIGSIAEIIGGGDLGATLEAEMAYVQSQMAATQKWLNDNAKYNPFGGVTQSFREHQLALQAMQQQMADLTGQYNLYLREEAAHPGFGSQLTELAMWYDAQQDLLAGNLEGLALLDLAYMKRREEILATGTESGLDALRDQLGDWLDKIVGGSLSPLTDQAKLELASKQFQAQYKAAVMGDEKALGSITQYAEQLLAAQEAVTGHGGAFSAVWADTLDKIKRLSIGAPQTGPIPVPGLQPLGTSSATVTGAAPASSGDIRTVADRLATMEQTMGRLLERLAASTDKNGVAIVTAITTTGTAQTRAVLTAADIGTKA